MADMLEKWVTLWLNLQFLCITCCLTRLQYIADLTLSPHPNGTTPAVSQPVSAQDFNFIVLKHPLDATESRSAHKAPLSASVEVRSVEGILGVSRSLQGTVYERIEVLRTRGVILLLSLQPVSNLVSSLCIQAGIAVVPGVEEEDAYALTSTSGADMCEYTSEAGNVIPH
jgi:hypothetical protein